MENGIAALPCATSARTQIALIIWYRANSEIPIYTVDLRAAGAHKHTSNTSRLRFDLDRRTLYVHNVSRALDQGRFRCRVDYRKRPMENTFVTLNVTGMFLSIFFKTYYPSTHKIDSLFFSSSFYNLIFSLLLNFFFFLVAKSLAMFFLSQKSSSI